MDSGPRRGRSSHQTSSVAYISSRPPHIRPDCLTRARLLDQLDSGLNNALTLISAPAGFGKTTLLVQWVARAAPPVAWVTAREQNKSALTFFTSLAEAVRACYPGAPILPDTSRLLRHGARAPHEYIAATLFRELGEVPGRLVLLIDDFHLIDDEAVLHFITDLIQDAPDTIHLILSARADPPLPLERLRARAELLEIRGSGLQFTQDEVEAFLTAHLGDELGQTFAGEATRRTEGWIAGLRLALISLQSNPHPEDFLRRLDANGGQHVMGYLISEVLAQQPPLVQNFLLRTSVLDQLSGDLCDAVTPPLDDLADGQAALERLERLNLFLLRLDEPGDWYRYHGLFQELLQHELHARVGRAEVMALHRKASDWYAQHDMIDEALRHEFKAEDPEAAAHLIESHFEKALNEQRWRDLERWLKLLPESLVHARPALLVALATVHSIQERLSAIPPLLRRAEKLMQAQPEMCAALPDTVLRGMCDVMWAQDHYWKSVSARGRRFSARAIAALPPTSTFARGSGILYSGMLYQQAGEYDAGARMIERVIDADESATVTARALLCLCISSRQAGRLERCQAAAERLLAYAQRHHLPLDINWAHYFLGWVAYERNRLDEARDHLLAVSEERYFANAISASDSLSALALTYQAQGRATEAEEALQDLNHYAVELNHSFVMGAVAGLRARLALLREDQLTAQSMLPWLDQPSSPPTPMLWLLPPSLTRARILVTQEDEESLRQAVARLDELEQFARSTHDQWRLYIIQNLQAVAYAGLGQRDEALTLLRQTLTSTLPHRFVRAFADCGPKMAGLLRELRAGELPAELARYVDHILSACAQRQSDVAPAKAAHRTTEKTQTALASPLTAREIEVLLLLDQRYSDKEIAQTLVISSFTVQAHTRSIYRKLDVSDRREATSKARTIGLIQHASAAT
jgi:LuxR family transcriptional regulator, maltose regulon positive regulatory protein